MDKKTNNTVKEELVVNIPLGELVAVKSGDPQNPGIVVYLRLNNNEKTEIDVAIIENSETDGNINMYTFDNVSIDEWQHKISIQKEDIYMIRKKIDNEKKFIISKIAKRADKMGLLSFDLLSIMMDIECADNQFNLRLEEFLEANDLDFVHDVCGIQKNINRRSYYIENDFIPRFATPQKKG